MIFFSWKYASVRYEWCRFGEISSRVFFSHWTICYHLTGIYLEMLGKLFVNAFATSRCLECPFSESGMKNWHFVEVAFKNHALGHNICIHLLYPECQCLKPPLFGEKLHWLKRYKRRASPNHIAAVGIILKSTLCLLRTSQTSTNLFAGIPKHGMLQPAASKLSASLANQEERVERIWPNKLPSKITRFLQNMIWLPGKPSVLFSWMCVRMNVHFVKFPQIS